jgi:hypothetical protein
MMTDENFYQHSVPDGTAPYAAASGTDAIWVARCFNAGYGMNPSTPERRSPEIFFPYNICRGFATPGFATDNHPALKRRATNIESVPDSPSRRDGVRQFSNHQIIKSPSLRGWQRCEVRSKAIQDTRYVWIASPQAIRNDDTQFSNHQIIKFSNK